MACQTGNKNVILFAPTRCLTLNKGVTIIIKKICKHYFGVDHYVHRTFSLEIVIFLD